MKRLIALTLVLMFVGLGTANALRSVNSADNAKPYPPQTNNSNVTNYQPMSRASIVWDFEAGLQGWTHTNGIPFPGGWDVQPSGLHASYTPPDAGSYCLWIDADAAFTAIDSAWSPAVVPPAGMALLKVAVGFYGGGSGYVNDLYIGVRTFSSGVWNAPVELLYYAQGTSFVGWDEVDISAYSGDDSIRVYCYFTDWGTWGYYAAVDNVTLFVPSTHDVGTISIDVPSIVLTNTALNPMATVKNFGANTETFDVTCTIDPGAYTSTTTATALAAGAETQVTFPDIFTFVSGAYTVTVYTQLGTDQEPSNDTLTSTVSAQDWLSYDDGTAANAWAWNSAGDNGWGVQFPVATARNPDWWVDSIAAYFWDTSWPVPGGTDATFRVYDGASAPTNLRWELAGTTIVRGAWNYIPVDTSLTHFVAGENLYVFYVQVLANPDCPGMACDAMVDYPLYMWSLFGGAFTNDFLTGDWMIRAHVISMAPGVSEWLPYTPSDVLSLNVPTITKGKTNIEFTLPQTSNVILAVYDILGRPCQTLVAGKFTAGSHSLNAQLDLPMGVYFYNLKTEAGVIARKFLLVD